MGFVDLLEALGRVGLAGVQVRVVLAGQAPERGADVALACGAGDAQQVVVVLGHGNSLTFSIPTCTMMSREFQENHHSIESICINILDTIVDILYHHYRDAVVEAARRQTPNRR